MSAAGKHIDRMERDFYPTPAECTRALLPFLNLKRTTIFLEPCKGDGAIYDIIAPQCGYSTWTELRDGRDYLTTCINDIMPSRRPDLIITNPPYNLAHQFIIKSLAEAETVIYLLRINFLGTIKRKKFWNDNPPTHMFPLSKRPVFCWTCKTKKCAEKYHVGHQKPCHKCGGKVGPGTDATEYAWFAWDYGDIINTDQWLNVL